MAACVAGLSIGYMSLDTVSLEIIANSSGVDRKNAKAARKILPVREQGNRLLVTLLLINTIVSELLPLVLEALYPGGYFALIASVVSIVIFGEIIPQAVCSRHPILIGAYMINFVKLLRIIMWPLAAPIAWLLDSVLGEELGRVYNRDQLKGLIDVHSENRYGVLTHDETSILKGTLDFSQKPVKAIMTRAEDVFMMDIDTALDRKTLKKIMKAGHSRIPLYTGSRSNVVALLLVKQLLLVDPKEEIVVRALINTKKRTHKIRVSPPIYCSCGTLLPDLLNEFQRGRSHMAIVFDDINKPEGERKFLGIATLEDIIEEVIMEEIQDETDVYQDNVHKKPILVRGRDGRLVRKTSIAIPAGSEIQSAPTLRLRDIDVASLRQAISADGNNGNLDYGPDESMSSLFGDEANLASGPPLKLSMAPGPPLTPRAKPGKRLVTPRRTVSVIPTLSNDSRGSPSLTMSPKGVRRVGEREMLSNLEKPGAKKMPVLETIKEVTGEKPPLKPNTGQESKGGALPSEVVRAPGEDTPLLESMNDDPDSSG